MVQPLTRTPYRNTDSPLGRLVYTSIGVIKQLPPGDYLSAWELTLDSGEVLETDVVTVHIVPSALTTARLPSLRPRHRSK
jgi:hypothetical protein